MFRSTRPPPPNPPPPPVTRLVYAYDKSLPFLKINSCQLDLYINLLNSSASPPFILIPPFFISILPLGCPSFILNSVHIPSIGILELRVRRSRVFSFLAVICFFCFILHFVCPFDELLRFLSLESFS